MLLVDSWVDSYEGVMWRHSTLLIALVLIGCGVPSDSTRQVDAKDEVGVQPFPADDTGTFLNGYKVEVPRHGPILWNGQDIDDETFIEYLKQYAGVTAGRGRIVVQFEPGVTVSRATWVRRQIIDAGICRPGGCAEAGWKAVRPVVN